MKVAFTGLIAAILGVTSIGALAQAPNPGKGGATPGGSGGSPPSSQASGGGASTAPFESVMLSYGALDQIILALADKTCSVASPGPEKVAPSIVIVDQASLANLAAYDAFERTAKYLTSTYKSMVLPPSASTFLTSALNSIATTISVASVSGISQNDSVQVDSEQMLVNSINVATGTLSVQRGANGTTAAAHTNNSKIVDLTALTAGPTPVVTPDAAGASPDTFADITSAVTAVASSTTQSASTITIQDASAAIKLSAVLTQKATVSTAKCYNADVAYPGVYGSAPDLKAFNKIVDDVVNARQAALASLSAIPLPSGQGTQLPLRLTAFNAIDTTFNQFLASWFAANSTTGQSALTSIVQGYGLRLRLNVQYVAATPATPATPDTPATPAVAAHAAKKVYVVYVNVAAAGGTTEDKKNVLTILFTGDWINYSGGAVVNAIVFDKGIGDGQDQKILYSGVLRYRTPITSLKDPVSKDATRVGDNLPN
jgi:hypothetical protein